MQFYGATQNLCFQVYGRKARQLYPWELEGVEPAENSALSSKGVGLRSMRGSVNWDTTSIHSEDTSFSDVLTLNPFRKTRIFEDEESVEDQYILNVQRAKYIRTWIVGNGVGLIFVIIFLAVPNLPR
jgi:hypothetical protein